MPKHLMFVFFAGASLVFSEKTSAQLSNLIYAILPVEKHEALADKTTNKYGDKRRFRSLGYFYLSFVDKRAVLMGLEMRYWLADALESSTEYDFLHEEFELTKIVKLDDSNYAFEGNRSSALFNRRITGTIELRIEGRFSTKVTRFSMKEFGEEFQGVMNEYLLLSSQTGLAVRKRFQAIDFGKGYAIMGNDSVKY